MEKDTTNETVSLIEKKFQSVIQIKISHRWPIIHFHLTLGTAGAFKIQLSVSNRMHDAWLIIPSNW